MLEITIDRVDRRTLATVAQIQSLVSISGEMFKRGVLGATAIVVTGHVLFGMTRMYERVNADFISPVHVFLELPPAESWLANKEFRRRQT